MRNMSFSLTTAQVHRRQKTVTRRLGWWNLKRGDLVRACVKCMGLKRGQHVKQICVIRIVSVRPERLGLLLRLPAYSRAEISREGFGQMKSWQFVSFFCLSHRGCTPRTQVNRIEFEYVP